MTKRNCRGSVLMLVIIFSLIMSILGFAVIYMNSLEYLAVRQDMMDERATLAMEAGLELGRVFLYHCDACLEDEADLEVTLGEGSEISKEIAKAMKLHDKGNHKDYQLFGGPVAFDNGSPAATYEIWISPADDTTPPADCYDYYITSRGRASYGFAGAFDTIVDGQAIIRMSKAKSFEFEGGTMLSWAGRYAFKYVRDGGRAVTCTPPTRVPN